MGSKTEPTLGIPSMNRNYPRIPRYKPIQQTNWGTLHITFPLNPSISLHIPIISPFLLVHGPMDSPSNRGAPP